MIYLIAGIGVFMGTHVFAAMRDRGGNSLRDRLGYGPYMGLFSVVALLGLGLIIYGYGAARPAAILYSPPTAMRHVNLLLMAIAMVLLIAAYVPTGYIKKAVKHPMILALKVWAFGHLLANGELNSVILFGGFLAYGVISRISAKRRGDLGPGPNAVVNPMGDVLALLIGLGLYAAIAFYLHPILFGVAVIG